MSEPLEAGSEIAAGYEVVEHLSRGRRLDVYDVWSADRGCRCVVKALRPDRAGEERPRRWLAREGELLERFTHPHIVRAYETLAEPPLIVLETLPGQTLDVIAEHSGTELSSLELAHLGVHLGSAVHYMHRNGVLHLDLKPGNVIATGSLAKLIDLSLVRSPGPAPAGIGTWCYMAPEQARGGHLGPAADVWGLGVVLFEVATGTPAFDDPAYQGPSTGEDRTTTSRHADDDDLPYPQLDGLAPRVRDRRSDLPSELDALIADCLEPLSSRRPSTLDVLRRLEGLTDVAAVDRRWA